MKGQSVYHLLHPERLFGSILQKSQANVFRWL